MTAQKNIQTAKKASSSAYGWSRFGQCPALIRGAEANLTQAKLAERSDLDARMSRRQVESSTRRMTMDNSECDGVKGEREQDSTDSRKASRTARETQSVPPLCGLEGYP